MHSVYHSDVAENNLLPELHIRGTYTRRQSYGPSSWRPTYILLKVWPYVLLVDPSRGDLEAVVLAAPFRDSQRPGEKTGADARLAGRHVSSIIFVCTGL